MKRMNLEAQGDELDRSLGVYLSVPFCRAKCSFCNFASDVSQAGQVEAYVERLCEEIASAPEIAYDVRAELPRTVDTIYLGGGTPSLLSPEHLQRVFRRLRESFAIERGAEITVECAPGQISGTTLEAMLEAGVNRISLGVQSLVDREAAAVGRLHTRAACEAEVIRLRAAGLRNLGIDLIAGLPHQTAASWGESLEAALGLGPEHVSVYLLEIDEDSRLGREVLAGGGRYGAAEVPDEELAAELYETACEVLTGAGLAQYEISNFARPGHDSRHNERYWLRQPYVGFGLDAHSMLRSPEGAVRFANTDDLGAYLSGPAMPRDPSSMPVLSGAPFRTVDRIGPEQEMEETFFLGLRRSAGVDLRQIGESFGADLPGQIEDGIRDMVEGGLLDRSGSMLWLTPAGRLLSNEVFGRLLLEPEPASTAQSTFQST